MVLPTCHGYQPLPPWGGERRNGEQAADPYNWVAIKQQEISPSTLKSMGGAAVFMVYTIPACLQHYLPGARFSDTWWDFYDSCAAGNSNANLPLPVGMTVGVKACTDLVEFYRFVTLTQMQLTHKKKVKDGVYCWHHTLCTLENKKERK